uniref:K Homology domain-containing protein n=1 Tax=Aureoumbra lagunensis TaxID=44058 RepID=A0A7S3NNQ1_9STRA
MQRAEQLKADEKVRLQRVLDRDGLEEQLEEKRKQKQVERAEDYLDFVRQQRAGPVTVALDHKRDDFTAYQVPEDCIGFIMGRAGQTLRNMEDEWGVLMFFARTTLHGKQIGPTTQGAEYLCIFGELPARRGAEIKVMSAVEHKHPGYCIDSRNQLRAINRVPGDEDLDGWGVETVLLTEENFRYALGTRGSARRKLATASGCIVEYVGKLACFVGYASDRRRGQDYLRWLLQQRTGVSNIENPRDRKDCTVVKIPMESVGFINGHHGESLKEIERESRTFCFSLSDRNAQNRVDNKMSYEPYYIFSFDRRAREYAADLLEERVREHRRIGGPRPPRRQFVEDHQSFGRQSRGYGGRSRGDFDTERDYGGAGRRRRRDSDFSDDDIDRRRRRRYD